MEWKKKPIKRDGERIERNKIQVDDLVLSPPLFSYYYEKQEKDICIKNEKNIFFPPLLAIIIEFTHFPFPYFDFENFFGLNIYIYYLTF